MAGLKKASDDSYFHAQKTRENTRENRSAEVGMWTAKLFVDSQEPAFA
jgi:hypothetical protein